MPETAQDYKGISNPAKILRGYMQVTGITDAKVLSETLGIALRTIQRLKLEACSAVEDTHAKSANDAIYGAKEAPKTPKTPDMAPPMTPDMAFSSPVPSRAHATKELPSEVSSYLEVNKNPPTPQSDVGRVRFADGRLVLRPDLKTFWLEEFGGDAKRLDLALIEVGGRIQANSSRPIEVQVSSQLARIVADKRDRDKRYQSAAIANAAKTAPKPVKLSRW